MRMEGGWQKYDLYVSYVGMMNVDDCSVHAPHFVWSTEEEQKYGAGKEY